jgi:hypothetical protein
MTPNENEMSDGGRWRAATTTCWDAQHGWKRERGGKDK